MQNENFINTFRYFWRIIEICSGMGIVKELVDMSKDHVLMREILMKLNERRQGIKQARIFIKRFQIA